MIIFTYQYFRPCMGVDIPILIIVDVDEMVSVHEVEVDYVSLL